jgi:predicted flap endonuclease-1-like 5' DNA nuclease
MTTAYILLFAAGSCSTDALIGLLNTLVPALLGWLAARSFFKVAEKDGQIKDLGVVNTSLSGKVDGLHTELTNVRLALSKTEADAEEKAGRLSSMRNELIIAENERNLLRDKMGHEAADAVLRAGITEPVEFDGVFYAANDPKLFKGIDGDIASRLQGAGFKTWAAIAEAKPAQLEAALAGTGLSADDLIRQAKLAVGKDWKGLKAAQASINITKAAATAGKMVNFNGKAWQHDDLELVEGIGPKIAELLRNAGINTWDALCKTSPERIREILDAGGPQFKMHDPTTWPNQACLAAAGDWDTLKALQDELIGGRGSSTIEFAGKTFSRDDLKIVEGIGPKIEELLHDAGITTWKKLSETAPERLKEILDAAGSNFAMHDPGSWPQQAGLAHEGQWDDLKRLQDELIGGR